MPDLETPLNALQRQPSHRLFILSEPEAGQETQFRAWFDGPFRDLLEGGPAVSINLYERHAVDITCGKYPPLPLRYLAIVDLVLDGAEAGAGLIDAVQSAHQAEASAKEAATWLYFPIGGPVGSTCPDSEPMLTIAFANGLPGEEEIFREFYATRHIRHALHVPALRNGRCFERCGFQRHGALDADYLIIAVYEQQGEPEEMIASFARLPPDTFRFPTLDKSRFAEWVYQPLART